MSETVQARVRQAVAALKQGELIILTDDRSHNLRMGTCCLKMVR